MATSLSITQSRLHSLATQLEKHGAPPAELAPLAHALGVEPSVSAIVQRARFLATTGFEQLRGSGSVALADIDAAVLGHGELQQARLPTMGWSANEAVFRDLSIDAGREAVKVKVPLTHVYEHNVRAFDAKFGVKQTLPPGERVTMQQVPERYGALLASYEQARAESPTPVQRRVLAEQTVLGRKYEMVAYQIGASSPPPGKVGLVLTAAVHGDELGAAQGLEETFRQLLGNAELRSRYEPIVIVPAVSPVSLDLGVREELDGKDPNRKFWNPGANASFSARAAEQLLGEAKRDDPFLFVDLHQDDRYAMSDGYALYNTPESEALARAGMTALEASGRRAVQTPIDGVENNGGVLPKRYPNTFTPDPTRPKQTTREVLLEINDPTGFWPSIRGVLEAHRLP